MRSHQLVHRILELLAGTLLMIINAQHNISDTKLFPKREMDELAQFPLTCTRRDHEYRIRSTIPNPHATMATDVHVQDKPRWDGIQQKEEQSEIYVSVTCLVVSGRRMPPALFLGCSSFSTSTRFSDGIRRFAMAARRSCARFFLGSTLMRGCGGFLL